MGDESDIEERAAEVEAVNLAEAERARAENEGPGGIYAGGICLLPPVSETTRLTPNGSTTLVIEPPRPCGLAGCVAELHVAVGGNVPTRVHLNAKQRRELIFGLGGTVR